jgi:phage terminase large subunit-like protein
MPASRKKLIPPEGEWRHWDVEYGLPVLRGEITVCQLTMKAVERHYKDLQTAHKRGFVFSPGAAQRPIDYVQKMFQHIKGPKAKQPLLLEPFQKFWTAVIFGWLEADTGFRRFRTAFEEMARKNGKSTWWGPLGAYLLTMDGEHGAEVYTIATTRDQAMAVFNPAPCSPSMVSRKAPSGPHQVDLPFLRAISSKAVRKRRKPVSASSQPKMTAVQNF